jgi:hypothetical protein
MVFGILGAEWAHAQTQIGAVCVFIFIRILLVGSGQWAAVGSCRQSGQWGRTEDISK